MIRSAFASVILASLLVCPVNLHADDVTTPERPGAKDRPRIGLVLAGGGAKGFAHVGVIKVLEEMRIPIDVIAGTSMGSLIGGLYASGISVDDLERLVLDLDWDDIFNDDPDRADISFRRKQDDTDFLFKTPVGFRDGKFTSPRGLIEGQKIGLLLKSLVLPVRQIKDFDSLPTSFRAVAADIETGDAVVLGSGSLDRALRASMSIPGVLSPVEIGGRLLVDGGIALNLPVDVARDMGVDVIIAVDLTVPLKKKEELNSAFEIMEQSTEFLTYRNVQRQVASLTDSDVRIHPIMGDITTMGFKRGEDAILIGKNAATAAAGELAEYSLSDEGYRKYLSEKRSLPPAEPVVNFIRVTTDSRVSPEVVRSKLRVPIGEPLDVEELNENLNLIFGLGFYERITYDLVTENGQEGLVVHARSRSWGPGYFKFGLNLESDLEGSNSYNFGVRYTRLEVNSLAGEWRTELHLGERVRFFAGIHQPLEKSLKLFVATGLEAGMHNLNRFDIGGHREAELRATEYNIALAGGSEISNWGEFRLGVRRGSGNVDLLVGTVPLLAEEYERGDTFFRLSVDTLDDVHFPHYGLRGEANLILSEEWLGADASYERFFLQLLDASTWDRNTLLAGIELGTTREENAPLYDQFTLGGFLNLSGYGRDELRGQHYGLLKLGYYNRISGNFASMFGGTPVYAGMSIEAGNVWDDLDEADVDSLLLAGSLFLGVDTLIGPLYTGLGVAEGGRKALYFYLGSTF